MTCRNAGTNTLISTTPGSSILTLNPTLCVFTGITPGVINSTYLQTTCCQWSTSQGGISWSFGCAVPNGGGASGWSLWSSGGCGTGGTQPCYWYGANATSYSCSPLDIQYPSSPSQSQGGLPAFPGFYIFCYLESFTITP